MKDPLTQLADEFGTDKGTLCHLYTPWYHKILQDLDPAWVVELGIYKGASLKMWNEYFESAAVIGVDWDLTCVDLDPIAIMCNLGEPAAYKELKEELPSQVDLIIDDASHQTAHQQLALRELWPIVSPGGVYLVEDAEAYGMFPAHECRPQDAESMAVFYAPSGGVSVAYFKKD